MVDGEADGEEAQAEEVDEENGQRSVIKMHQPRMPTQAEREEHAMAHLRSRSWGSHRVKSRGGEMKHLKVKEGPERSELRMDFWFPGEDQRREVDGALSCRSGGPA